MPRAVVTGGAGFLGSHLCERLLAAGWDVVCIDSELTGTPANLAHLQCSGALCYRRADVSDPLAVEGRLDWVLHLASPASPRDYHAYPIETLQAGALGTLNSLRLAEAKGAGYLLASTSEAYGDPQVHPQPESYWGNVNPVGPRSVYDEAKRFAEAAAAAFGRERGLVVKIVRIFNTYGPRMRRSDGRAVPEFIDQALTGRPLTVHGDGSQTRSLCYVDDLIEGIFRLVVSDYCGVVNLGNPQEVTVLQLAEAVKAAAGSDSEIVFVDRPEDDPEVRCPDISRARRELGWEPRISLEDGLRRTVQWARQAWLEPGRGSDAHYAD
ncbi:MAG TPA: NAD-dependent epimerase/dehydratase family protein [Actinomycetota bacterium]|nr:NAD-dependent epimerase/dehydratase family protein [Actinomycetota bacterium]